MVASVGVGVVILELLDVGLSEDGLVAVESLVWVVLAWAKVVVGLRVVVDVQIGFSAGYR